MQWMKSLFPLNRSLSGKGNLETLLYLQGLLPNLQVREMPSGTSAFDWIVPDEWIIEEAYIETTDGRRFAEFKNNNLHVVGYSEPIDKVVSKEELLSHLHYIEEESEAIPYVTSYYKKTWGFCLKKSELELMGNGPFKVLIKSKFKSGSQGGKLIYGELLIEGKSKQEVVFSTYICHPSMANNELSGPVVATALAAILQEKKLHYSYRFLFLPETIGAIYYLSRNLERLRENVIAGWVLTCIGDPGQFSYVPSRTGLNYADRCTLSVFEELDIKFRKYTWKDRGSDERQYCAPRVDLPFCSITRSKYGTYREYHTSLDNLEFVTDKSLEEAVVLLRIIVEKIESQRTPKVKVLGEPQLGKRGMYPSLSKRDSYTPSTAVLMNVLSYADGNHTLMEIAKKIEVNVESVREIVDELHRKNIVSL